MKTLTTSVARTLYAVPFGIFGIFHFINADMMAGMVPIPGGVFWIYLTGLGMIAASIAIITGKVARLASLLVALMLLIFILGIHIPGIINAADDSARMQPMQSLLKDMALMGGALVIAGTFSKDRTIQV